MPLALGLICARSLFPRRLEGSNRRAEVGGTESRMLGKADACMIRMVFMETNKSWMTSVCVISNPWSS